MQKLSMANPAFFVRNKDMTINDPLNQIDSMRVGLNYENNLEKDRASTITFGYYDLSNVKNGEDGLNWYLNVGDASWAVWLDDIKLDGKDIQTRAGAKVAHIDSANLFIQMPMSEFKQLEANLKKVDPTVK